MWGCSGIPAGFLQASPQHYYGEIIGLLNRRRLLMHGIDSVNGFRCWKLVGEEFRLQAAHREACQAVSERLPIVPVLVAFWYQNFKCSLLHLPLYILRVTSLLHHLCFQPPHAFLFVSGSPRSNAGKLTHTASPSYRTTVCWRSRKNHIRLQNVISYQKPKNKPPRCHRRPISRSSACPPRYVFTA